MNPDRMRTVVLDAVGTRHLLRHPFYRRWEAGELSADELARYAEQYRHVEAALPAVLESILDGLEPGRARTLVEENLADERGSPMAHVDLFEHFASRVGARSESEPSPATAHLVELQRDSARRSAAAGIAVLAAYEVQAGAVAVSKAEGLRRHYGIDEPGTRFWDVHGELEVRHADWSLDALRALGTSTDEVADASAAAAEAWWRFLDERESAAAAAA